MTRKEYMRGYHRKYRKTPKRAEYLKKYRQAYNKLPKSKESCKRYDASPRGKEVRKAYRERTKVTKPRIKRVYVEHRRKHSPQELETVVRNNHLTRTYGIDSNEYNRLLEKQNGKCAICFETAQTAQTKRQKRLYVDHDHRTNKVRGLLCHKCNTAIGLLKESLVLFDRAKNYLNKEVQQ